MSDGFAVSEARDGASPKAVAMAIILREHRLLASVLILLERMVSEIAIGKRDGDLSLLAMALCYIDDHPETYHHSKEDRFLCAPLRARCPQAREVIERVDDEHRSSRRMLFGVKRCLIAYLAQLPDAPADLVNACSAYVKFQLDHMALVESELLPMANEWLIDADWHQVAAAFGANQDPLLAADEARGRYQRLYQQIEGLLPLPHREILLRAKASLNALQYLEA